MSTALDTRREELEHELDVSRRDLRRAMTDLRQATRRRVAPRQVVRRHPWALLAGAALLGLWAGLHTGAEVAPPSRGARFRRTTR